MGKPKRESVTPRDGSLATSFRLPKGALSRINLGQSFAEYDRILLQPGVFVRTPATTAALDATRSKCFFVGRRGTGKTAIASYLATQKKAVIPLHPNVFGAISTLVEIADAELRDVNQRPFRTLVECFKRAIEDELIVDWVKCGLLDMDQLPKGLRRERNYLEQYDFDLRIVEFIERTVEPLLQGNDKEWLKELNRAKSMRTDFAEFVHGDVWHRIITIDRIDDSWDGSDKAVLFLMALMHACVELNSATEYVRPLLFLRENIFERVRQVDNEFARVETCVVSLDWTEALLVELIERRLQHGLITKPPIGHAWDCFFETVEGVSSRSIVFGYCQQRPRDIVTYCELAIESAQSKRQEIVRVEDLQIARRRFSDSRFKDLCDEYAENYPQIQLVLGRFHGLGREFTIPAIDSLIRKLLVDEEIQRECPWLYEHTTPSSFIAWLFSIGFAGVKQGGQEESEYRSLGARSSVVPPIDASTSVVIHPTYQDALALQDIVVDALADNMSLQQHGVLIDLPGAISRVEYNSSLLELLERIKLIERGQTQQNDFEAWVGDVIRLCFFRSLVNLEPQVRDHDGRVRRDWIAANRAASGFWEMIRARYNATQIIFECKNYDDLEASDFQQIAYYMGQAIGDFGVIVFRGDAQPHYYGHIKRIAVDRGRDALVLLLNDKDLKVFLRQASKGKVHESHIQDNYDRTVRNIS